MWGKRVAELHVWNSNVSVPDSLVPTEKTDIDVGVDSGQAGFFDEAMYPNDTELDESFYAKVCRLTSKYDDPSVRGGVIPFGVVSQTGYGDGGYDCYVARNDAGEVVSAKIVFISDEEEDEDEEQ